MFASLPDEVVTSSSGIKIHTVLFNTSMCVCVTMWRDFEGVYTRVQSTYFRFVVDGRGSIKWIGGCGSQSSNEGVGHNPPTRVWVTILQRGCGSQSSNEGVGHNPPTRVWVTILQRGCGSQSSNEGVGHNPPTRVWVTILQRGCGSQSSNEGVGHNPPTRVWVTILQCN